MSPLCQNPPSPRKAIDRLPALRSFSAVAQQQSETALPPNLTFDRRSSFAPKEQSFLVPPTEEDDTENDVAEGEDSGYESGESSDDEIATSVDVEEAEGPRYVIPLPDRLKADVHGIDGSINGSLSSKFLF